MKKTIIILGSICLGLLAILSMVDIHNQPEHLPHTYVNLIFNEKANLKTSDYAIKQENGKFLFAGDTPNNLKLGLLFGISKELLFSINPLYPDWICKREGTGKAFIQLQSNHLTKKFPLRLGKPISFSHRANEGETVYLSINNPVEKNCGRAEVRVIEENQIQLYPLYFCIAWALFFSLLLFVKLPLLMGSVGIAFNLIVIYANSTIFQLNFANLINATNLALFLAGALTLLCAFPFNRYVRALLAMAFLAGACLLPMIYISHSLLFGTPATEDTIHAILQTNVAEAFEFIRSTIRPEYLLLAPCCMAVVFLFAIHISPKRHRYLACLGCIFLLPTFYHAQTQVQRTPVLENYLTAKNQYFSELATFKSLKESREKSIELSDLSLTKSGQKVIVVIGESANKNHMSLYGYPRDSTPWVDELYQLGDIIRFDRAYANHTHTNTAVSLAITNANQYSSKNWTVAPSLLEIAAAAGVKTAWITNQQLLGAWDNHVSVIAQEADQVIGKNKMVGVSKSAPKKDEVLVDDLKKILLEGNESQLIFLHLQGSHAYYCSRFPETAAPFEGKLVSIGEYGSLAKRVWHNTNQSINCYDNSIYYTDKVISEIVDFLDSQTSTASLLYFSDHADDVIGKKAHNSAVFTYPMAEIPVFFWANKPWKNKYFEVWENLKSNSKKVFTSDHIFETVSGLIGFSSSDIDERNDLSSSSFLEVEEPKTLAGRKLLAAEDNWKYWQQSNINEIVKNSECSRIIPHRANSIGKIRSAISDGLCGFEIDVLLRVEENGLVFVVGHDKKTEAGITLEQLLTKFPLDKVKKIWLDLKGVKQQQISKILDRLNFLNSKFKIKDKAIVEMSFYGEEARVIRTSGYQLSYYLPTKLILDAAQNPRAIAKEMNGRITAMQPVAISFDLKLYSYVKKYLEPLIEPEIKIYHTWFPANASLIKPDLIQQLSDEKYYKDKRVQTVLLPYHSQFSL